MKPKILLVDIICWKKVYLEAIGVTADCLEAIYNLGLVNIHLGSIQEATLAFDKLNSITNHNCEVRG